MERCPVCRGRFKDTGVCHRCGADFAIPLKIENQAVFWQQRALLKLADNNLDGALQAAQQALQLQRDPLTLALLGFIRGTQQ